MKTQGYFYRLINTFELVIRLRIISCEYEEFDIELIKDFFSKRRYKSLISVVNDGS